MNDRKGKLIVIDGTDGSGKTIQTNLLEARLIKEGYSVRKTDFPQYGHHSAALVEKYLDPNDPIFSFPEARNPCAGSLYYILDRVPKREDLLHWLSRGDIVVSNRYDSANKGHQGGKIENIESFRKFIQWLDYIEHDYFGLPRPDKTILLHMPLDISDKLKTMQREASGQKKDLHESDSQHLMNAETAYLACAELEKWDVIECGKDGKPFLPEEIHEKVYGIVKKIL